MSNYHIKRIQKLLSLQLTMIREQALIWVITFIVIIAYCIIQLFFTNSIRQNHITIIDGLSLSFISAFIFYYFTVFFPESNKRLDVYQNIYLTNELMLSLYDSIIELFGGPSEEGFFSPNIFVEKLVSVKNKELDEYTIDPYYMGRLDVVMNEIQTMYDKFSSEYSSYLSPTQMRQKTMINNAGQILVESLSPKMSYKHVEGYFQYLLTFYGTLKSIESTTSPYVYKQYVK